MHLRGRIGLIFASERVHGEQRRDERGPTTPRASRVLRRTTAALILILPRHGVSIANLAAYGKVART
jgi:hypothetical protein